MLVVIIIFILGCIFLGVLGAGVLAPFVVAQNNKRLKEIKQKVDEFQLKKFSDNESKEVAVKQLKRELIEIKGKITEDGVRQEASDLISLL